MDSYIKTLAAKVGRTWPTIAKANAAALEQRERVKAVVAQNAVDSPDISVVVFGSLARGEWTSGSDLDWTMLVDGHADHQHANAANRLAGLFESAHFSPPGSTRTFGTLTFGQNLVHQIGNVDDTNRNTTQRLLLLLESLAVNQTDAYDRILRGVLHRYLQNDFRPFQFKVPRFLLNDLHRYWRTICVDYASKYREQAAKKWAIRNVKLRMSRKLIFASGLVMCYACDPSIVRHTRPDLLEDPTPAGMAEHLISLAHRTPLSLLAEAMDRAGDEGAARIVFDAYEFFLSRVDDPAVRSAMDNLSPESAATDRVFQELQENAVSFEDGLEKFFFDTPLIKPLTRRYGVF